MPEGHGYPNEEKERKQRIKKLKAKTSKMRLGNIYDEQEENKDKGSAANIKTNTKGNRAFNKRRKEMGLDPVPVVKPKPSLIASLKKKQKIAADDFDDFMPVGQSTPKQKKQMEKNKITRGRNNEIERRVRRVKYDRRTQGNKNMGNFDKARPNEKEKLKETKLRITKNLPTDKVYSTTKYAPAGSDYDYSRPAQLKLRLAAVEKDNYLKMEKDWDEFDEQSASLERDMDMSTDMNDINSYGSELEQRYNYRNKNAPKKPSVSKL
tara:strand:+ start:18 stop:812 length:795 start_codon:yes stop_codon:yes gene_type:complete